MSNLKTGLSSTLSYPLGEFVGITRYIKGQWNFPMKLLVLSSLVFIIVVCEHI